MNANITITVSDEELRQLVMDYVNDKSSYTINSIDEVRFRVNPGYSGEMGGKSTRSTCSAVINLS